MLLSTIRTFGLFDIILNFKTNTKERKMALQIKISPDT